MKNIDVNMVSDEEMERVVGGARKNSQDSVIESKPRDMNDLSTCERCKFNGLTGANVESLVVVNGEVGTRLTCPMCGHVRQWRNN